MKYYNPLLILQNPDQPTDRLVDKKHLLLQKKKLLAEIELSDDKTISLNGSVLNKHDVITLFDRLQNSNEFDLHMAIMADEELNFFLEYGEFTHHGKFAENELYELPEFVDLISPYYEENFTRGCINAFKSNDLPFMELLWENPLLLNHYDLEKSFGRIKRYLQDKMSQLLLAKDQAIETRKVDKRDFDPFFNSSFIGMLNLLPPEFQEFIDDYALELINTGVGIQHIDLGVAVNILKQVKILDCDVHLQEQNEERYDSMYYNLTHKETSTGWGFSKFHWFWILFVVVKAIASFDSCDDKKSYDFSKANVTYTPSNDALVAGFDDPAFNGERYDAAVHMTTEIAYYHEKPSPAFDPATAKIGNGENVYKPIFSLFQLPFRNTTMPIVKSSHSAIDSLLVLEANKQAGLLITKEKFTQNILVENETNFDAIAFVQTADTLFSCFVNAKKSTSFFASDHKTRVYFYLGNGFNKHNSIPIFVTSADGSRNSAKLNGLFNTTTASAIKILGDPYIISVNKNVADVSVRKNRFVISYKNGEPQIQLHTDGSGKVKEIMTAH